MHHLEATARRINFDGSRLINICGGFSIRIEGKKTIVITESHKKELQKNTWVKSKRVYKNELNCFVVYRGHEESCNSMTVEAYLNGVSQAQDMLENEIATFRGIVY
uniref:Uncharacterized protein n=1 Tax=Acrobeloides nanus TaxID=290746 RepID=A0A914C1C4_9BILA